jgi:hypothetical protein
MITNRRSLDNSNVSVATGTNQFDELLKSLDIDSTLRTPLIFGVAA